MTGEELKAWRKSRGLSQRAVAELLGIAQNRVWAMERKERPVPVSRQTERQIEVLEAIKAGRDAEAVRMVTDIRRMIADNPE